MPYNKDVIFAQCIEGSEDDYIVNLSLSLLEACSLNPRVPLMISRIILNNLTIQILEQEIDLSEAHKQFAILKIPSIRADLLKEYLDKLKLNPLLDSNYLLSLAQ